MNRSTRNQCIAWLVCCGSFGLLIALQIIGSDRGIIDEDALAAIGCWIYPFGLIGLPIWGLVLFTRWKEGQRSREWARASAIGRCPSCGYDTTGLPERCPECGSPVITDAWVTPPTGDRDLRQPSIAYWTARRHAAAWCIALLFLLGAATAMSLAGSAAPAGQEGPAGLLCCMTPVVGGLMGAWGVWIVWHWDDDAR